ncbi:MAG: phosphoribosylanthranilate isomerase [Lachnospiraceae bacterium]|nr:phosphoribosylanthranilate isomerase [Lachnospiraceae bacterium]
MTRIKMCGIKRIADVEAANTCRPEYVGFVFAPESKRFVSPQTAKALKQALDKEIQAVGVFVDAPLEEVSSLLKEGIIDLAQLHGSEGEAYIRSLKEQTNKPVIKAFRMNALGDKINETLSAIEQSSADFVLLDSKAGCGEVFEWGMIETVQRPYFLAGGLDISNVSTAIEKLQPYAVDVSSGIETDGVKDKDKMEAFVTLVRENR